MEKFLKDSNFYIPFIKGILTPHAGLDYILPSIQKVIKYVNFKQYNKIIILSTNHYSSSLSVSPNFNIIQTKKRSYNLKSLETKEILKNRESCSGNSNILEHSFLHVFKILDQVEINEDLEIVLILVGKNYENFL